MTTKYKADRTGKYASKAEAARAGDLKMLQRAGVITDLQEQVRFQLIPKQEGERPVDYIADFTFRENGNLVVMDVKGFRTREYILKRKLMLFIHGIKIREVA